MGEPEAMNALSFQITFGIVGMLLLTGFIVVFFVVYRRRLLQQQLYTQKMRLEYQSELLQTSILAQEAERERIATELHDSIGGLLSATKIYVSNVAQTLPSQQFQLFKDKALEALSENISEVRTITNDLLPQSLERLGIVTAAQNLLEKLIDLKQMQINFHANKDLRFRKDYEKALFRILQELINNTIKHSEAKNTSLVFYFNDDGLTVNFREDGQGFDRQAYYQQKNNNGLGLKNIESRIAFLRGEFSYETAVGKGVAVQIKIPLINANSEMNFYELAHQSSHSR